MDARAQDEPMEQGPAEAPAQGAAAEVPVPQDPEEMVVEVDYSIGPVVQGYPT